ncbi:glycosyltransferase family 9 protein [Roseivirga sp. UBA1976]|uniref:glycosyltransferase family 9 protein n=1 Tax=Roseivirga sp. UBA1976 TaxID=1947386 RepID=UPI00257A6E8B|nr:glycosyltransferase family 9 protein [Roseivirga sp. UBA1976]|tara:strand:+ start:9621 stop:10634 length:1014 start_codon:yes stop_codon:yes gene_type:complete
MPKKVLIIRFSSIGDIVLTTPVIRVIKTQMDDVEVHYATKKHFYPVLEANPYIDKFHLLEGDLKGLIRELKAEKFDFVVDLHNNLRTRRIKAALQAESAAFPKLNWKKWLIVNLKVDKLPNVHIVDRYLEAARPLGVKNDALGLDYFIPEKDEVEKDWLPETHQKEFVAFAIGGNHETKKLPLNRMIELCDKINKPIVLLGGKEDAENGEQIAGFFDRAHETEDFKKPLSELGKKALIYNGCGKFSINQSASILKKATYVFTHDTGMMHIAAALKKNVFSIWGNTIPEFGMYPYRTKFTILEKKGLGCRPCSKIGYKKCPKGHFKCMNEIVFDFWLP